MIAELILVTGLLAVDGDSVLFRGERIRIMGVDSPEIHCQCESECRAAWAAKRFTQNTLDGGAVTIERQGLDKYRRTLARVYVNGQDLAAIIIAAGHGRPYHGEKRQSWCGQ